MANLLRVALKPLSALNANKTTFIAIRNCGWIRDWKPGPTPKTQEEKEAAAKKYNLIPEDYETYPEGTGYGDYPMLPEVGQDARDPFEDFDYHYRRRNFGEMLHKDYDVYTSDRYNPNEQIGVTPFKMVASIVGIFVFLWAVGLIDDFFDLRNSWPLKPKQYPKPGVIHYTFDPLD